MTSDKWKSATLPIELPCGRMRITVVEEDGRPHKVFPSEMAMLRPCTERLLSVIVELTAEVAKTASGYKTVLKILHGPSCDVVMNQDKQVRSCVDEIAKILEVFDKKEEKKE